MTRVLVPVLALLLLPAFASAQPVDPAVLRELRWRGIGPIRGGRTKSATGVPGRPGHFYIGPVNGGVWKSTDYGRIWVPLFDDQPTGSIGAIAVAASNPDVVYVGSGEGMQRPDLSTGDGVYRSTDAGRTWRHLGLRDAQQIAQIAVDAADANRLFVAALGHPYGPNEERGIFRSLDGGETFVKVLYVDADTGGADVAIDPSNPQNVFAVLWEARQAPWENGEFHGPGSGLFKSTDGGTTWRRLVNGLPDYDHDGLGRIGIGIAPSRPSRMFATVDAKKNPGLYRSDDAGESWVRITADEHVAERADDFAEVKVHPLDPDTVFTAAVVVWKSKDGGKTFEALRGAPGGDDYQKIWIDPKSPDTMIIAADQGAIVTVNGGVTWSSWFNQSTAQLFHVSADNAFPYRVCGGQQDSGSACVNSRGNDGQITLRDWHPAGAEEYGYAVPDPLNPDLVYGGKIGRWDRRTGQSADVTPVPLRNLGYRVVRTQPIVFSPLDPHTLYFASNTVWKTTTGGNSWTQISPDLTRKTWDVPGAVGKYRKDEAAKPEQRGVIYALAPSPKDRNLLWAGTDDGLLQVTRDGGKKWQDVTPPELTAWMKVSILEASHFDAREAWAAINTLRLDEMKPHLLRTRDGGKSWVNVVKGIPDGEPVLVVREDPRRKGLLFAGTERTVYVSFDDGDEWQSLRVNLPVSSVRDLIVKDDDLVIATHGRGFWILDDLTPLRQLTAKTLEERVHLFAPQTALRLRWDTNTDTPVPPDEPAGLNPPDGAIIDYWLQADAAGPVTLEVLDGAGKLVRRFASTDAPEVRKDEGNIPRYWLRPAHIPSAAAGLHRFVWDLHYPSLPAGPEPEFPMAAVAGDTPRDLRGPWVVPGSYTLKLSAGGESFTQPLTVKLDPRVKTKPAALQAQLALSLRLADALAQSRAALADLRAMRKAGPAKELDDQLAELEGTRPRRKRGPAKKVEDEPALAPWADRLSDLLKAIQSADAAPATQLARAAETTLHEVTPLLTQFTRLKSPPAPK